MKFSQQKMLRLGAILVGIVVVYGLFSSYASGKGAVVDNLTLSPQELGGEGAAAPMADGGPYVPAAETGSLGGNAVQVSGMQGATPSSQQTYTQRTLESGELLPKGEIGASWAAVNPTGVNDLQGQNFLQSSYQFVIDAYRAGFYQLVTKFKAQSILNIFRIISKNPPNPGMGYEVEMEPDGK